MSKSPKQTRERKIGRSSGTGQFIGRTKEGFLIPEPDFKPSSFTVRQLEEAIRVVRRRQAAGQAG